MIEFKPRDYQQAGIDLMLREPGCGLFLEPGSGKTIIGLTAADILLNDHLAANKLLVVAPKLVAQEVWTREAAKWKHTAHLQIQYLDVSMFELYRKVTTSAVWGGEARDIVENDMTDDDRWFLFMAEVAVSRTELLPADWRKTKAQILGSKAQIHVISRDHLVMLARVLGADWPYDLMIGDESTSYKNISSTRSRAMSYLRKESLVRRLCLMTGTPSPKGVENLFAQVRLLDGGQRLGAEIGAFRKQYMVPGFQKKMDGRLKTMSWNDRPGAALEITGKIKDICLAVRADTWREVDPPLTVERWVALPAEARDMYQEMSDTYHLAIQDATVTAAQAAVLGNKLIQIASGAVFDDEKKYHILHDAKLDALDELIEELDGEPLLIMYWFNPTLDRLKKRYGNKLATTKTKGFLDQFAAGRLPLLALQPGSAGHGLDGLQHGGHHVAVVDLFHDWELYQQTVSRLDRSGQKHRVTVHQILADDTKDFQVARVLADRAANQAQVMNALKYSAS